MVRTHGIAAAATSEIHFVEQPENEFLERRRKNFLECDGESCDLRSVKVLTTQFVVHDVELIRFVCPRCGENHQSLLFG